MPPPSTRDPQSTALDRLREEIAKAAELRAKTEQTLAEAQAVAEQVERTVENVQRESAADLDVGSVI